MATFSKQLIHLYLKFSSDLNSNLVIFGKRGNFGKN